MKALTIWEPWASLVMVGAKPYEFRRWDYLERFQALVGQRIVIHAGARPMKLDEIDDILIRMTQGDSSLNVPIARPMLQKISVALSEAEAAMPEYRKAMALYRRQQAKPRMVGDTVLTEPVRPSGQTLPLACALGTAILRRPVRCTELFKNSPDSDRIDHHMWAWPLTDLQPFDEPVELRGLQGFWDYPMKVAA